MCGIVGITGADSALPFLIEGLGRLEYRGYDSAGVALEVDGGIWRCRRAGKLAELVAAVDDAPGPAPTGIGHTRWATHGRPNERNAHPHVDASGQVAVVHNGIIENFRPLRAELEAAGVELTSDTDTEVLAHLIGAERNAGAGLADAVRAVLRRVSGSFAVAVVDAREPGLLVGARRSSPLVAGVSDDAGFLASDIPAVLGRTRTVFVIDEDQVVEVRPGQVRVTDLHGTEVPARARTIEWDLEAAEKGGYPDFMLKEIHEQPEAIAETLRARLAGSGLVLDEVRIPDEELRALDQVFIVGCGTSYHAGMVAKTAIEHWARLPCQVEIASEFRYRDPIMDRQTLVVGVSQSGETLDTMEATRHARLEEARVLVVSNVVDSSMAREADAVLYTRAGPEIGVAATKTHVAQVVGMQLLALYLAQVRGTLYPAEITDLVEHLRALPGQVDAVLGRSDEIIDVARRHAGVRDFFFLGRGPGYPVALEGALKLKEISYLRAEGYPAGELKHGPIALIEPGTVVVAVATRSRLQEKIRSNVQEVKARGATVVVVANDGDDDIAAEADEVLWVPATHELFAPAVDVVALQLYAYGLARELGRDVDQPRNLAKTVTVE